jgi:hypothetical protein
MQLLLIKYRLYEVFFLIFIRNTRGCLCMPIIGILIKSIYICILLNQVFGHGILELFCKQISEHTRKKNSTLSMFSIVANFFSIEKYNNNHLNLTYE